jgi:hypothetical protein
MQTNDEQTETFADNEIEVREQLNPEEAEPTPSTEVVQPTPSENVSKLAFVRLLVSEIIQLFKISIV